MSIDPMSGVVPANSNTTKDCFDPADEKPEN